MGLNLHRIVRRAITFNHPDQEFEWYRSLGDRDQKGLRTPIFAPAVTVKGNLQSESDSALDHADLAGKNTLIRKLYLYADSDHGTAPFALLRNLTRGGDYFKDSEGFWWYAIAVEEDFSQDGWIALRVQLQTKAPTLTIQEPDPEEPDDGPETEEDGDDEETE